MSSNPSLPCRAFRFVVSSLARVVKEDRIAPDFLLVPHSRVCAMASTCSCPWIDASNQVGKPIEKLRERHRVFLRPVMVSGVCSEGWDKNLGTWFRSIVQLSLVLLLAVLLRV